MKRVTHIIARECLPAADNCVDVERIYLSRPKQRRPLRGAATTVVPLPKKLSSTIAPRVVQSMIASATKATGFMVGCRASRLPSSLVREKELTPG